MSKLKEEILNWNIPSSLYYTSWESAYDTPCETNEKLLAIYGDTNEELLALYDAHHQEMWDALAIYAVQCKISPLKCLSNASYIACDFRFKRAIIQWYVRHVIMGTIKRYGTH